MNQRTLIRDHLIHHDTITQREASVLYGVGRLAARTEELRQRGDDIKTKMIPVTKSNGESTRVGEYSMSLAQRLEYLEFERSTLKMPEQMERRNALTAQIANLRTRVERMKARNE